MMNTLKIAAVQALENKRLLVRFTNGIVKIYDCTPLLGLQMFHTIKNDAFFKSVKADAGGYGISWDDDADLSECELWTNGVDVTAAQGPANPLG